MYVDSMLGTNTPHIKLVKEENTGQPTKLYFGMDIGDPRQAMGATYHMWQLSIQSRRMAKGI